MTSPIENDTLRRFLIENTKVRGEWIHLDQAWQQIRACGDYPPPVEQVLGQATAAICLLSAILKYEGSLILQINSTGPIEMLVVQATSDGEIRGLARFEQEAFSDERVTSLEKNDTPNLRQLFGDGQIVISLVNDQAASHHDRYQGIVELDGANLSECLQRYFEQSEQLKTRLYLAADQQTAAGLLLQRMPGDEQERYNESEIEDWEHATALTDTISDQELLTLDKGQLLHRLFHEDDVRLFDGKPVCFQCTCSTEKIENAIRSIGQEEANQIINEQGNIEIQCEFCNKHYQLDAIDVARLFDNNISQTNPSIH